MSWGRYLLASQSAGPRPFCSINTADPLLLAQLEKSTFVLPIGLLVIMGGRILTKKHLSPIHSAMIPMIFYIGLAISEESWRTEITNSWAGLIVRSSCEVSVSSFPR